MHSTASDGTDAPHALAGLAQQADVAAIALTDHDSTHGLVAAGTACQAMGIRFVPGIEISCDPGPARAATRLDDPCADSAFDALRFGTLHILGLFVRHDDPLLQQVHERMTHARDTRNPAIVARLRELGVGIEYGEVLALAAQQGTAAIGRPHIAQVLLSKGYVQSIPDAFRRYIGQGAPAYVRRDRLHPLHAIEAIHHAGGLAILAHPVQLKCPTPDHLEHLVHRLQDMGLDGMEVRHSDHDAAQMPQFAALADRRGLLPSGGSDYHGTRKPVALGSQRVPLAWLDALAQRAGV